jgi:hypothetical protein
MRSNSTIARRAVIRLTPWRPASARSDARRAPGAMRPSEIVFRSFSAIRL